MNDKLNYNKSNKQVDITLEKIQDHYGDNNIRVNIKAPDLHLYFHLIDLCGNAELFFYVGG